MTDLPAGVVTRLVAQKKDPDRVSVFLDGAFAFGVHVDVALAFGLAPGRALTEAECEEILAADAVFRAKSAAFHYLAYRARTEREVRRKLSGKGFEEGVIDEVVGRLHTLGYLDDEAYARTYVRARFAGRGYGPQRIRAELLRRGVDRAHIDAALDELLDEDDVVARARRHAAKRWPRLAAEPDPRKRRKKLTDFLVRRGFSFDVVRRVVDELAREET
ncbi:RecX family transcriptional regulator [Rhodocaloribacter sp.]